MKKLVVVGIAFIMFLILGGAFSIFGNQKEVDNEIISETLVVIEDEIVEDIENVWIEKNDIFLPVEFIKKHFDSYIYISEDGKRTFVDLSDKDFAMEEDSLTEFIKNKDIQINIPLKIKDDTKYASINQLEKIFNIDVKYNIDSNIVTIDKDKYNNKINHPREQEDKGRVNITWEYVYEKTPDISDEEKIEGLDVVCPTWFSLTDEGIVINKADLNYVHQAHEKGYKIWGLVDNGFDPKTTSKVINNKDMKDRVIAQIAFYASLYDLDGINIDFENIYYEDKDAFVKFVEDLTQILKKQNLIVSIDVTVPGGSKRWSKVYDRERLAKIVDYVALMAYDEHWATSPVSGSVASIGWVERGIKKSLDSIPKEKLLLGIPFYTRIWKETKDKEGKIEVSSKAIPIKNVEEILDKYDAEISWDPDTGQHFATYKEDDVVYKVWIEDAESIKLKIQLANKYGLKGIASWRKGYEYEEVWEVINTVVSDEDLL